MLSIFWVDFFQNQTLFENADTLHFSVENFCIFYTAENILYSLIALQNRLNLNCHSFNRNKIICFLIKELFCYHSVVSKKNLIRNKYILKHAFIKVLVLKTSLIPRAHCPYTQSNNNAPWVQCFKIIWKSGLFKKGKVFFQF